MIVPIKRYTVYCDDCRMQMQDATEEEYDLVKKHNLKQYCAVCWHRRKMNGEKEFEKENEGDSIY